MKFPSFDVYCRQSGAIDEEIARRIDAYQADNDQWSAKGGAGGTFTHRGVSLTEGAA